MNTTKTSEKKSPRRQSFEKLFKCSMTCLHTLDYCLRNRDKLNYENEMKFLENCAALCSSGADAILQSKSSFHRDVYIKCISVCEETAIACGAYPKDERMALCAEICQNCATHCRKTMSALNLMEPLLF